jgi:glycosyltransferase involved in cell wall biosynthesis
MKILLLSTYDIRGGAARAAFRLCEGLRAVGHDAKMLVQVKVGKADFVVQPDYFMYHHPFNKFRGYLDLIKPILMAREKLLFSSSVLPSKSVIEFIDREAPDIVHLHWIAKGFLQIKSIEKIHAPIAWTLHDMWGFTGGCHYSGECTRYINACGVCPILKSKHENDLSRYNFRRKGETYGKLKDLTIITPSSWLAGCVQKSPLLSGFPVQVIPNALNLNVFFPENKLSARKHFGIDPDRKIILYGAQGATKNKLKGFDYFAEALGFLQDKNNIELAIFGSEKQETTYLSGFKVRYLGHISDDTELRKLYSAADVMVVPSIQEVFGQTASEAMACGIPVVAYNGTGVADIVDHEVNGYLAEYKSVTGLAKGIQWCLYEADTEALSRNARQKVLSRFTKEIVIQKHVKLYHEILEK